MKQQYLVTVSALVFLVACGGGSGGSGGGGSENLRSVESLLDEGLALLDDIENAPVTAFADLPAAGSATYDGIFALTMNSGDPEQLSIVGEMSLMANFSDDEVEVELYNAIDTDDRRYDGSLVGDGKIEPFGPDEIAGFDAELTGEFDRSGADPLVATEFIVGGVFAGDDAEYVYGLGAGTFSQTGEEIGFEAELVGEK